MKKFGLAVVTLLLSSVAFGQLNRPTIFIEGQNGFETYLAAAMSKKNVPVDVVMDRTKATYILKSAPI